MSKRIIYQVLPRLWGNGKFSAWGTKEFDYLKTLGVDYLWLTGIPRHASGKDFVKGDPGSPYAISDWKDTNPYLADDPSKRLEEFSSLVERIHRSDLKCIIDFIPNHVARDYEGPISHFDWCDADWTDTLKVDYSAPQTLPEMVSVLEFWAGRGVDGFRFDMVELVPREAMGELIREVKGHYPSLLFIAEVYNRNKYREYCGPAGFDLLYDKSGSYDILKRILREGASTRELTWNWQFLSEIQGSMLNFLENHDEQRLASAWFASSAGNSYAALAFSILFGPGSFMLYFGQEVGENAAEGHEGRTSIFEWNNPRSVSGLCSHIGKGTELEEGREEILEKYRRMMAYAREDAFRDGMTWDLCYCQSIQGGFDPDRHFAFLRYSSSQAWAVICNFGCGNANFELNIPSEPLGKAYKIKADVPGRDACIYRVL